MIQRNSMAIYPFIGDTPELPGDNVALVLPTLDSVAVFTLKADVGYSNNEMVAIDACVDCGISLDGIAYTSSVSVPKGAITESGIDVYVKRAGTTVNELLNTITNPGIALSPPASNVFVYLRQAPNTFTPTVSSPTQTGCSVAWSTTDPNGLAITYKVAVTTSTTPPSWTGYADCTSPYTATGLTASTNYYAHIRAVNADGLVTVGTSALFTTSATADTTAPTLAGTLAATAGVGQVALEWSDATDNVAVAGYDVEYGPTTSYGTATTSATSAKIITGLTAGQLYYFRVRAYDAAGNKSSWLTASATVHDFVAPFSDVFTSLDASRWATVTAGSGTVDVSSGEASLIASASTDAAILVLKKKLDLAAVRTYKVAAKANEGNSTLFPILLRIATTQPSTTTYSGVSSSQLFWFARSGAVGVIIGYVTSAGTFMYWNGTTWTTTFGEALSNLEIDVYNIFIVETNGTQIRGIIKSADEATTLTTTSWINIASIRAYASGVWLTAGEPLTDAWTGTGAIDAVTVL